MRPLLALFLVVHGLIHIFGFLKAFGLADAPQLTQSIGRPTGIIWLLAAMLALASAATLFAWQRGWWLLGAAAVIASQIAIVSSWNDAKFGTLVNGIVMVAVVYAFLTNGPSSFEAEFRREVERGFIRSTGSPPLVTERDLAPLPAPVQRYLRATGVVGAPRVQNYRVHFRGRIRADRDAPWLHLHAVQQSFVDQPTRLFLLDASMKGLPVQAFHRLTDGSATMRVRVAGAFSIADASGAIMDRSETVTLFNDMCLIAPATLIESTIAWEALDDRSARARFRNGSNTITATLFFDEEGLLRDFRSDDRSRSLANGRDFVLQRFTTPVREYRKFDRFRVAAVAEAHWHDPKGEFSYAELEITHLIYNTQESS
jgi:hypothetical protein